MNQKKAVVSRKNLPTNLDLGLLLAIWLLLDRFNIPQWGWGIYWTVVVLGVIGIVASVSKEEEVVILKEK